MRTDLPSPVRLSDYRAPDFQVETVDLDVALHRTQTRVRARIAFVPGPDAAVDTPLRLDGDELALVSIALDGRAVSPDDYTLDSAALTLHAPPRRRFVLDIETTLDPSANTKLMGLYRTGAAYCTQCEAEGFRRIMFFPDRPDVMAVYTVRIEAERTDAPVLLSNGNRVAAGACDDPTRHFAVWHDPWPKPSYLFALVGGDLACVSETFVTCSGRNVALEIHVEQGKESRCAYAMDALKRCMRWDEEVFGREYDLDTFMIVAVSDFNMGAMENKGLNVFNDKYVLALPEIATDQDYAAIEAIIAHEYFHNWTGNRITCRDWFQLCLKEGLTVFRDQEFTADQRSRPVKRIADVRNLRALQFAEDSGPLAHAVRPKIYHEINNFYTSTVYEKGAELIRMLKVLIGTEAFARGMDLYFERCDGTAATIEDFLACFAERSGEDLTAFARWYDQAGTPTLGVRWHHDPEARTLVLQTAQVTPPTPGQPDKHPVVIPLALGLIGNDGHELPLVLAEGVMPPDGVLRLTQARQNFTFVGVPPGATPSLLRGFSAPVRLDAPLSPDDLLLLMRCDSDSFNRWQATQIYAGRLLTAASAAFAAGRTPENDTRFLTALEAALTRENDPALAAQTLALPSESDIARDIARDVDTDAVRAARLWLRAALGRALRPTLHTLVSRTAQAGPYRPDAAGAGRRALRLEALGLLVAGDGSGSDEEGATLAQALFDTADNMTERFGALLALSQIPGPRREAAFGTFESAYAQEPLLMDKWFALQATIGEPETLERVRRLMRHPAFTLANPNRLRALVGSFANANPSQFNRADGAGYALLADVALEVDPRNPQTASRLLVAFRSWRMMDAPRRAHAEAALRRIAAAPALSPDVADIVTRSLA